MEWLYHCLMIFHSADDIHLNGNEWFMSGVVYENTQQYHDPMLAALMHSQTATWLNSINPQRSLAIFALMLTFFLHLVLQRHHCVMVAYKRGWTLTGLCPQDCNHSFFTGALHRLEKGANGPTRLVETCGESQLSLHILGLRRVLLTAAAGSRRTQRAAAWLLNQGTPLHTRTPPPPPSSSSVLMTNQNEKWRRGRAWKSLICSAC